MSYEDFTIKIRQDNLSGTDSDGSRDGRFLVNKTGFASLSDYSLIDQGRIGRVYEDSSNNYEIWHWFRFKIPVPQDPDIFIIGASLYLQWNPPPNCNVGLPNKLELNVCVVDNNGLDGPIPSSAANGETLAATGTASTRNIGATDSHWLNNDPGQFVFPKLLSDEAFLYQDLGVRIQSDAIDQVSWAKDNVVTLIVKPVTMPEGLNRHVTFKTWSWIKDNGEDESKAPILVITYRQQLPEPATYDKAIESEVDFDQFFNEVGLRTQSVSDTVTFEQTISATQDFGRSVESSLDFTQTITRSVPRLQQYTLYQECLFEQIITGYKDRSVSLESDLTFEQYFSFAADKEASVNHQVDFEQDISAAQEYSVEVEHFWSFTQTVSRNGTFDKQVEHEIVFDQTITPDSSDVSLAQRVEHTLTFEVWVGGEGKTPFTDVEVPTTTRTKSVEDTVTFEQFISVIGGETCDPTLQERDYPTLTPVNQLVLEYPTTSPTDTVTLPAPLLSNREEIHRDRIQRKTVSGTLITYVDDDWVEYRIFRFKFESLTDTQRSDMFSFLAASLGRPIKLTDHESREWIGVMRNPNGEFATFNAICGHTTEFDFECVPNVS